MTKYMVAERLRDGKKAAAARGRSALLQLISDSGPTKKRELVESLLAGGYITTLPSDLVTAASARISSWFAKLSREGDICPSEDGWIMKGTASTKEIAYAQNQKGRRGLSTLSKLVIEIDQMKIKHPDIADALDDDLADALHQIRLTVDHWNAT